jgi:hypothetical protein
MAQTLTVFDNLLLGQLNGGAVDFDTDTIKVMLLTNTASPAEATHDFIDDLSANEVTPGGNYAAGGSALASKTVNLSGGTVTFDAADLAFSQHASNPTNARKMAIYKDTGTPATSRVIAFGTLAGADIDMTAGDLTLVWNAAGIIAVT